jgi:hypothetical protein
METRTVSETKEKIYSALAVEAEAAVASVKDPELRRVAFEKILATLLDQSSLDKSEKRPKRDDKAVSIKMRRKLGKGPKAYLEELVGEGFFKNPQTIAAVKAELANRGRHIALTSISGPLQSLTQERRLRREKVAANKKSTKTTYAYSKS